MNIDELTVVHPQNRFKQAKFTQLAHFVCCGESRELAHEEEVQATGRRTLHVSGEQPIFENHVLN